MTTTTVTLPAATTDELMATMLRRVRKATARLDEPLTLAHIHALRLDLTVLEGNLCTLQRLHTQERA